MTTIHDHRNHELRVITGVIALICATACATSIVPGLEDLITRALIVGAVLVALGLLARFALRWVRERREDREDALTAAIWRAEHATSHVAIPTAADRPADMRRLHVVGRGTREVA